MSNTELIENKAIEYLKMSERQQREVLSELLSYCNSQLDSTSPLLLFIRKLIATAERTARESERKLVAEETMAIYRMRKLDDIGKYVAIISRAKQALAPSTNGVEK